jgi:hypothetical protein
MGQGQMNHGHFIIVAVEGRSEHTIVSAFLPQVGQRIVLDGINKEVEVVAVSFTRKTFAQSFRGWLAGKAFTASPTAIGLRTP